MPTPLWMDHDETTSVKWASKNAPIPSRNHPTYVEIKDELERIWGVLETQGIDEMVSHVYARAPFEFQRQHLALERAFRTAQGSRDAESVGAGELAPLIEQTFDSFPRQGFPRVAEPCLAAGHAAALIAWERPEHMRLAEEIVRRAWHFFCYHLRLDPQGHRNVPDSTLEVWKAELEAQRKIFDTGFSSNLREAARELPIIEVDSRFEVWMSPARGSNPEFEQLLKRLAPALEAVRLGSENQDGRKSSVGG